jgi:hypothetical protein
MNLYFTDTIKIIDTKRDKYGTITETESVDTLCRIVDWDKLSWNRSGSDKVPDFIIYLDQGSSVKVGDKIRILTKSGSAFSDTGKKWTINKLSLINGFVGSHYEGDLYAT